MISNKRLLILIFFLHWSFISISVLPDSLEKNIFVSKVKSYTSLFFYQRWRMFAPEPALFSKKIKFKCKTDNSWSDWVDPIEPLLKKHYLYRLSHHGRLIRLITSHIQWLGTEYGRKIRQLNCYSNDTPCINNAIKLTMKSPSYYGVQKFVINKCKKLHNKSPNQGIQITIAKKIVQLNSNSHKYKYLPIIFFEDTRNVSQ